MRIRISHETVYRYEEPARSVIQTLRLTPRNHESQYVENWRIDVSENCQLDQHEDAFGNITHVFSAEGPFSELRVQVEGEVDTQDTAGIVKGAIERFPPSLYLRETPLTRADPAIAEFAQASLRDGDSPLSVVHNLLDRIHEEIVFDGAPTHATTTAAESFALKRGVCQDLTHIFIAAARSIAIPARYIGGHFQRNDGVTDQEAGHAWAEALRAGLRLDRLRCRERHLRDRRSCPRRGRVWIISAPRRCAAPALAAAARRSMWRCASARSAASAKVRARPSRRPSKHRARLSASPLL